MVRKILWAASLAAVASGIAGCAGSGDRPDQALGRAEASIKQADVAGARQYGSAEMDMAQAKLASAKTAADDKKYERAANLAAQAELDAELAAAKNRTGAAKKAAAEVRASTEALQSEVTRTETQRAESPVVAP